MDYISSRESVLVDAVVESAMSEARALVVGVDPTIAAEVGLKRIKAPGKVRKDASLTECRTVALNAAGNRLPHNARGVVAPGSNSRRGKAKAHMRAHDYQVTHAKYIDDIRRMCKELRYMMDTYRVCSCNKRKKLRGPMRAVWNRLQDTLNRSM